MQSNAQTEAGTRIINQSSAEFEWFGVRYRVNSNLVYNNVAPVYGVSVTPDGTTQDPALLGYGAPGQEVIYSYIVTNTGNVTDDIELKLPFIAEESQFEPIDRRIYLDVNGNGLLESGEVGTTLQVLRSVPPGGFRYVLVLLRIPVTGRIGQTCYFDFQGFSVGDPEKGDVENVNQTIIPEDAVLRLNKQVSPVLAVPGDQVNYELNIINQGALPARGVEIVVDGVTREGILVYDPIPFNEHGSFIYASESLEGSSSRGILLYSTDDRRTWQSLENGKAEPQAELITDVGYLFEDELVPQQQLKVEFSTVVPEGFPTSNVPNEGSVHYRTQGGEVLTDRATNKVIVEVPLSVEQVFIGPQNEPRAVGETDVNDDLTIDPGVSIESEDQFQIAGNFVFFINTVENAANGVDTINISLEPRTEGESNQLFAKRKSVLPKSDDKQSRELPKTTIPSDWKVQFFKADRATPLIDTNGDGIADVGPMEPGQRVDVVMRLFIPTDTPTTNNEGAGFQGVVRAESAGDAGRFNLTINRIPEVQSLNEFWDNFRKDQFVPEVITPGSEVSYRNTFGHSGNFIVSNARIIDDLSPYLTNPREFTQGVIPNLNGDGFITATATYDEASHRIIWQIPTIPPGFRGELDFTATISEDTPAGEEVPNSFTITSDLTTSVRSSNTVQIVSGANVVLDIQKEVNREEAMVGDPVTYTVDVSNEGPVESVSDAIVTDFLAKGFRYIEGSASVDGEPLEPEISENGGTLKWYLGSLKEGESRSIVYSTIITGEATRGDGINTATIEAIFPGGTRASLDATAKVTISEGVFEKLSTIIGRVYIDKNDNRIFDEGELGIEGVRVYLDDGTYSITDRDGLYSIPAVPGKMRVIRVDETTLSKRYVLAEIDTQNAGRASSRFIDLRWGTMQKANFRVLDFGDNEESGAKSASGDLGLEPLEITSGEHAAEIGIRWKGDVDAETFVELNSGIVLISLPGKVEENKLEDVYFPGPTLQSIRTYVDKEASKTRIQIRLRKRTSGYPNDFVKFKTDTGSLLVQIGDPSSLDNDPSRSEQLAGQIESKDSPVILSPLPGTAFMLRDKITVSTSAPLTAEVKLLVNGIEVGEDQIGTKSLDVKSRIARYDFVSVPIKKGINTIRFESTYQGKLEWVESEVVLADRPTSIEAIVSPQPLYADGVTEPVVAITLFDANGVPTGEATVVTVDVDKGDVVSPDFRPLENGHQAQIRDGRALVRLSPASSSETRELSVTMGEVTQKLEIRFKPYLRDWIIVGGIEGTLGDGNVRHSERDDPSKPRDEDKALTDGSVSLFAKGTLPWWDIAATINYDSERDYQKTRLFREFQPDDYYPIYGDSSELGYEAPSRDQYYAKFEKGESYVMYGDIDTDLSETELAANSRRYNGTKVDIKTDFFDFKGFAAYHDQALVKIEIPGQGISGFYQLPDRDILRNSEEIIIEVRDQDRPENVLESETLDRFSDYNFDYQIGRILFKRPIRAFDDDFNPVIVVVRYEIEGDQQQRFWAYGGRGAVHDKDRRVIVGGTRLVQESGDMDDVVEGVDATVQLTESVQLRGEYATSETFEKGKGDAYLVELESTREDRAYRIFYRDLDEGFENPGMRGSTAGRMEYGGEASILLNESYRVEGKASVQKEARNERKEGFAIADMVYTTDFAEWRIGGGYAVAGENENDVYQEEAGPVARAGVGMQLSKRWRLDALHQHTFADVVGEQPTRSELELGYQFSERTLASVALLRRDVRSGGTDTNLEFGLETLHSENLSYFNRYRIDGGANGSAGRTNHGFDLVHPVSERLRLSVGGEIVKLAHGDSKAGSQQDFWAVTTGVEYSPMRDETFISLRQEYRTDERRNQYFNEIGGTTKLNPNQTVFARNRLTYAREKEESDDEWVVDFLTGWAYRPVDYDEFNFISDFEVRYEEQAGSSALRLNEFVVSTEANWQPSATWVIGAKYAARYSISNQLDSGYFTDVKALSLRRDINDRFYAMLGARWLRQYESRTNDYSWGIEAGLILTRDLQLGVGYNFEGFRDRVFSRGDHWERGFYIRLRLKFDESILGWLNWMERNGDKEDSIQ